VKEAIEMSSIRVRFTVRQSLWLALLAGVLGLGIYWQYPLWTDQAPTVTQPAPAILADGPHEGGFGGG
jgi:hypothetical protein